MAATKPPPKIQKESIWRTLPRACFGLIAAVVLDVVAMLGYATLLLMDGASPSAFYFAAVVLTGAFILVFFTMSAVLSENTIELLATVCVGTCVTIMVFWLRLGGGNLDQVQRTTERGGMMDDLFPDPAQKQFVLTLGALATQGTIQIAFVVFGYLSYKDFGWRIFKLFGTDLGMRQVYETYLWFKALLKMDALLAGLNVAAGFAFFYFKEGESWRVVMIVGVGANLLWVCLAFAAVKLEKSLLVRVLMPPALLMPGYLAYKAYTIFYNEQLLKGTEAYTGVYEDVWESPIYMTIFMTISVRLCLLYMMHRSQRNFARHSLKGFSMHKEFELPPRLRLAMPKEQAEGIKAMVRGSMMIATMEVFQTHIGDGEGFERRMAEQERAIAEEEGWDIDDQLYMCDRLPVIAN